MKFEVEKLDINKLVSVTTGLDGLEAKVDDLDINKLKTVSIYLKNLIDVVSNEVVKKTLYNKLNTKVKSLEKKITNMSLLFSIKIATAQINKIWRKKLVILRTKY